MIDVIDIKIEVKGRGGSIVEAGLRKSLRRGLADQKEKLGASNLEFIFEVK